MVFAAAAALVVVSIALVGIGVGLVAGAGFERREVTDGGIEGWDAQPHTGRTHQVRVHAAALGLPILGDRDHGGRPAARLFLHAAELAFDHPEQGRLDLTADRPPSFEAVLAGARPDLVRLL